MSLLILFEQAMTETSTLLPLLSESGDGASRMQTKRLKIPPEPAR